MNPNIEAAIDALIDSVAFSVDGGKGIGVAARRVLQGQIETALAEERASSPKTFRDEVALAIALQQMQGDNMESAHGVQSISEAWTKSRLANAYANADIFLSGRHLKDGP